MKPTIVIVGDSMKGSPTSIQVADAAERGVNQVVPRLSEAMDGIVRRSGM